VRVAVNALIALKELGFSLEQCCQILDEQVSIEELIVQHWDLAALHRPVGRAAVGFGSHV
jgi:hypothetical protein